MNKRTILAGALNQRKASLRNGRSHKLTDPTGAEISFIEQFLVCHPSCVDATVDDFVQRHRALVARVIVGTNKKAFDILLGSGRVKGQRENGAGKNIM